MDIPVPQIMLEQVAEVIQVIPQEPGSERTAEQTVDVPATTERMTRDRLSVSVEWCTWPSGSHRNESSSAPCSLSTNHSSLRPSSRKSWCETNEVVQRSAALSRAKAGSDSSKTERAP